MVGGFVGSVMKDRAAQIIAKIGGFGDLESKGKVILDFGIEVGWKEDFWFMETNFLAWLGTKVLQNIFDALTISFSSFTEENEIICKEKMG